MTNFADQGRGIEMGFAGRNNEIKQLRAFNFALKSGITAIYGRRRIAKAALVEEAFKATNLLKFEGLEDKDELEQRLFFRAMLARHSGNPNHVVLDASNWTDLLIALSKYLAKTPCVVFFDEYQWMATKSNRLTAELKYVWDNYFQKNNRIHLIICGSISSFIVKQVVRSKALYGRIDNFIDLQPLSIRESVVDFSPKQ